VTAGLAGLWCRHEQTARHDREHLARIEALVKQRSSQRSVQAELGAPIQKRRGGDCVEEWVYNLISDRRAILCFNENHRATDLKVIRSFDRRDY
jgi:hypothetical protein